MSDNLKIAKKLLVEARVLLVTARRRSMTYGVLPTWEEFDKAFQEEVPNGKYSIKHGSSQKPGAPDAGDYSSDELWSWLKAAVKAYRTYSPEGEEAADWARDILDTLGFEWV